MIYQYLTTESFDLLFNNGVKFVVKNSILFTKLQQTNDPVIKEKLKPLSRRGVGLICPYGPEAEA